MLFLSCVFLFVKKHLNTQWCLTIRASLVIGYLSRQYITSNTAATLRIYTHIKLVTLLKYIGLLKAVTMIGHWSVRYLNPGSHVHLQQSPEDTHSFWLVVIVTYANMKCLCAHSSTNLLQNTPGSMF